MMWRASERQAMLVLGVMVAVLLLDLDFREPNQQVFPTTAGGIFAGRNADAIYLCDEPSGDLVDEVASLALAHAGAAEIRTTAVGFYDGTDAYNKKCLEGIDGSTSRFEAASATSLDVTTESMAILVVWRASLSDGVGGNRPIIDKRTTSGYLFDLSSTTGFPRCLFDDGVNGDLPAISAGSYRTGAWHCALAVFDRDADSAQIHTEQGSSSAVTPLTATGSLTATDKFQIRTGAPAQIAYVAVFTGADAEGLDQSDVLAFWTQYLQYTTPELDTYTRASLVCPEVGDESGFGIRVTKVNNDGFAFGYDADFSHASKLGALIESAKTNLCKYSEQLDQWSEAAGSTTVTANTGEAPDGTFTADSMVAIGGNQSRYMSLGSLSLVLHTKSIHVRRIGGSDVAGSLRIYNEGTGTYTDTNAFTATSEWVRVSFTWTPSTSGVQRFYIKVDTLTEGIEVWGMQAEAGYLTSYIPTTSAAATRAIVRAQLAVTASDYMQSAQGEMETVWSAPITGRTGVWMLGEAETTVGNNDRHQWRLTSASAPSHGIWDSSGTSQVNEVASATLDPDAEHTSRYRWNSVDDIPGHAGVNTDWVTDGSQEDGALATTWTAGAVTLLALEGISATKIITRTVARFRIWDGPRSDTP